MEIKQIGEFLEVECCGCGECLLIGEGDRVNFRTEPDSYLPSGFLCAVCYKHEDPTEQQSVEFRRHNIDGCLVCGKSNDESGEFQRLSDENGNGCGLICPDCVRKALND
jgi:hypothetical protein